MGWIGRKGVNGSKMCWIRLISLNFTFRFATLGNRDLSASLSRSSLIENNSIRFTFVVYAAQYRNLIYIESYLVDIFMIEDFQLCSFDVIRELFLSCFVLFWFFVYVVYKEMEHQRWILETKCKNAKIGVNTMCGFSIFFSFKN